MMKNENDENDLTPFERGAMHDLRKHPPLSRAVEDAVTARLRSLGIIGRPPNRLARWILATCFALTVGIAIGIATARYSVRGQISGGQYLLLLYEDQAYRAAQAAHSEEREREYGVWARALAKEGHLGSAGELAGQSDSLVGETQRHTDATMAEPVGYFLVVAKNRNEALQVAAACPHLRYGGRIEVREIITDNEPKTLARDLHAEVVAHLR